MHLRIIIMSIALLMSNAASAEDINIQLGSDSARFMYITEAFGQNFGRLELEAGFLYHENGDGLANVGILVRGESVSVPMIVSIGARAYYADLSPYTVGAIAIGGDLLLVPDSWGGLGLGAYFYAAPGVVAFADAEDLREYGVYLNYQITPQARIAIGYQQIDVSITNGPDVTFDKGAYFGLNINF